MIVGAIHELPIPNEGNSRIAPTEATLYLVASAVTS